MRLISIVYRLTLILSVASGCGSSSSVTQAQGNLTRSPIESERLYDDPPLTDRELIEGRPAAETSSPVQPSDQAQSEPPSDRFIKGYRIQIHSFQNRSAAESARQQAQRSLSDLEGVQVYTAYEPPYYKVRAGDCRTREEAEHLLNILRSREGYQEAWIVETMVKE